MPELANRTDCCAPVHPRVPVTHISITIEAEGSELKQEVTKENCDYRGACCCAPEHNFEILGSFINYVTQALDSGSGSITVPAVMGSSFRTAHAEKNQSRTMYTAAHVAVRLPGKSRTPRVDMPAGKAPKRGNTRV